MSPRIEGPTLRVDASCFDCRHESSESYAVQGDSGHSVYCTLITPRRSIGDSSWRTPEWCPLLAVARQRLVESLSPGDAAE